MPQVLFPPLLADVADLVGVLVGLLFLVMWIVKQIGDAKKQVARPRGPQPAAQRRAQPPAQVAAPVAGQAGQQADPLRNQVEEFLRRAGRQPQQQPDQPRAAKRPPRRPASNQIEVLVGNEPVVADRRTLSEPFRPMNQPAAGPLSQSPRGPNAPRTAADPPRTTLSEHVTGHIGAGARAVGQRSSKLGQQIIADDAQFDVQLKAKFDHTVGSLAASRIADPVQSGLPTGNSLAAQIAAMLANPEGVQQAMVVNEILRRPSDRW